MSSWRTPRRHARSFRRRFTPALDAARLQRGVVFGVEHVDDVLACGLVVWRGEDRDIGCVAGHGDVADSERVDDHRVGDLDLHAPVPVALRSAMIRSATSMATSRLIAM